MNQALSSYQKMQISGMGQRDLIVMLYAGAVKFLTRARKNLEENSPAEFSDSVERAHRIIHHLYTSLNFEEGGEIAERLAALYTFIIGQLYVLNSTKNDKIIADLLIILNNLKEGWQNLNIDGSGDRHARVEVMPPGNQTIISAKV
jgi:flagellar protein FliS